MVLCVVAMSTLIDACAAPSWGLEAIDGMETPPDGPLSCTVEVPADASASERSACTFDVGASGAETLGLPPSFAQTVPVRHVVVLMRENRTFDHLFARLHDEGQPATDAQPAGFSNPDLYGHAIASHHARTTCIDEDADHQWDAMHEMVHGGAMDGFVRSAAHSTDTRGQFAMSTYDASDLPFYNWLATTFALADRHFPSAQSGTDPNRDFLLLGTNAGIRETGSDTPDPSTPSIFRALMDAGFTWGVYSDGLPLGNALGWDNDEPGVHPLGDFLVALDHGSLPNVAFVDGIDGEDDDGATADLQVGEAWLRRIYRHAIRSPQWLRTAMVWTYDEGGGFADHVPPPSACAPSHSRRDSEYTELGPRVPLVVISPYAKPHYVSHVVEDHTAITRFIEVVFGLPAMTARDANSGALLDLFDFSCGSTFATPPDGPAPGRGGCED